MKDIEKLKQAKSRRPCLKDPVCKLPITQIKSKPPATSICYTAPSPANRVLQHDRGCYLKTTLLAMRALLALHQQLSCKVVSTFGRAVHKLICVGCL